MNYNPRWSPAQYAKFAGPRLRPALDLLAHIRLDDPKTLVDLGCGRGNVAPALLGRWPDAKYLGIDLDPAMLEEARSSFPTLAFSDADATTWTPDEPVDLVYSNAVLHWVPHHADLLPRLLHGLAPGGALAIQMPNAFDEPVHRALAHVADEWSAALDGFVVDWPVLTPEVYYRMLAPLCASVDIWETTYLQTLRGHDPVFEWIKGSGARPYLERLPPSEVEPFSDALRASLARVYPPQPDGATLLPYPRLFMVAHR